MVARAFESGSRGVPAFVANASLQQDVTVIPVTPGPRKVARPARRVLELLRTAKVVEPRLTQDQKRRLLELDYATRTQGPKSSFVKALPPMRSASEDPFARKAMSVARRGDPLDGSL